MVQLFRRHRRSDHAGAPARAAASAAPRRRPGARGARRPRRAPPPGASPSADLSVVYESAKIAPPAHGYTVLKVAEMLQSEHIRALPADVKRKSILVALDAAGVKVAEIVEDAVRRDRALDTYERVLQKHLDELAAATAAENQRLEDEIAQRVAELRARIDENTRKVAAEQDELLAWRTRKQAGGDAIAEAVGTSCRRIRSRPRPVRPSTKETPMFARLSRLFRAWMGFFISIGEDPEVMLQDAIEEMRMTMPKLNSVLVATRATVIRLEEERDALQRQDRNLTASIQAALRDGSAAARSVAEEDAIQLQQLRQDLTSTQEQLAAAQKAHESAKMSVDALKTKLKEKIEISQRALKERQKAQVMKEAADAIVELQSYGVASTADKFLEQIKQEVAESKAAVEVATGGIDTAGHRARAHVAEAQGRRHPAAVRGGDGHQRAAVAAPTAATPSVGGRVGEKPGS